jgi:hypothetical protein
VRYECVWAGWMQAQASRGHAAWGEELAREAAAAAAATLGAAPAQAVAQAGRVGPPVRTVE